MHYVRFELLITCLAGQFGIDCLSANFEIARVKQVQFQNLQKSRAWFIPKIAWSKHMVTGQSYQANKHFVLKLISFNIGWLQNSGQLQNNSVNGAILIITNHVISIDYLLY